MTNLDEITTVQVHAWLKLEDGSIEYADAEGGEEYSGWGIYLRVSTPDDPQQPFDVRHEQDFLTKESALEEAENLSRQYGGAPIDVY